MIKPTGIEKVFPLLNVNFHHPTQEHKDFYLALTPDGNGHFRHDFSVDNDIENSTTRNIDGKWRVTISPFENHWKIQNILYLPQAKFIEIAPDLTQAN